jgi:hypothetical protein
VYATRTPAGVWLWTPDPLTVHAGVADAEAARLWSQAHGVTRVTFVSHPEVPALGAATHPPVWVGQVESNGWVAWHGPVDAPAFWTARPAASLAALREALVLAGRPWRLWTPAALGQRPWYVDPPAAATQAPWYLGRSPEGALLAWHATGDQVAVLPAPAGQTPVAFLAALTAAHVRVRGFCPGPVRRAFWRRPSVHAPQLR